MHPLAKGPDIKRYTEPISDFFILVPYEIVSGKAKLINEGILFKKFPQIYLYLKAKECQLRNRENGKMDKDDGWWGYNYPKNIEKQSLPRLLVAGTAPELRFVADALGKFTQDDRRVFAVIPNDISDLYFLLGIMNGPVANHIFRQIARPKANDFFDIDKQFIAPLPIPKATDAEKQAVADRAKHLQDLHTRRRDLMDKFDRRLQSPQMVKNKRTVNWLWADIRTLAEWKQDLNIPKGLAGRALTAWAKEQYEKKLDTHLVELDAHLHAGALLVVENDDDELRLLINGNRVIELFDQPRNPFIAAQWRQIVRSTNITEAFDSKKLVTLLLDLRATDDDTLAAKLVEIDSNIQALDIEIATAETEINTLIYSLYRLTTEEIAMINKEK
jgi:hypothetical protein